MITDITVKILQFSSNFQISLIHTNTAGREEMSFRDIWRDLGGQDDSSSKLILRTWKWLKIDQASVG